MTTRYVSDTILREKNVSLFLDILSLTKPRLSALVIFTSALGLFLAPGQVPLFTTFVSIAATSGLVAGACVINCWMERDIDRLMERTKNRPLPTGRIQPRLAFILGLFLILSCLSVLFVMVNPLTGTLGLIATLTYVFLYTPMKKISSWALFAGAIPGAIPPLMGWTTVTNSIGSLGMILFGILFVWQLPHFLSISMYHSKDYNNADFKIFPTQIGISKTIHKITIYTFILMVISLAPFYIGAANKIYRDFILLFGGSFFVFSLLGYRKQASTDALMAWARKYFYASLIYLPVVFLGMIFFK